MANAELSILYKNLEQATCAEDLFGIPQNVSTKNKEKLQGIIKNIYRRLVKTAHPDHHMELEDKEFAEEVFILLNNFYQNALKKIENETYGKKIQEDEDIQFSIVTQKRKYTITSTIAQGDLCTIYGGYCSGSEDTGKIVVKVAEDPADNDLIQNEIRILNKFQEESTRYSRHLPTLLDQFKSTDNQLGTIMRYIDGYDLYSIRDKYPKGIPQRHIIWIFRRTLSVLGYAHSRGVLHGNIEPDHIIVSPKDHNVFLIDWCYSLYKPGRTGQGFRCFNEDYSPPEVAQRKPPIPASDLYSLGKCMIYLLGGNIQTLYMPKSVDKRIQNFIKFFCRKSAIQRAQDAWEMYGKLDELREEVFGPHIFEEFVMEF